MNELRDHFRRVARAIAARAEVVAGTGDAGTTGRLREGVMKDFLRPHLPGHFKILSGTILDSDGSRSGQQDCVLVDGHFPVNEVGAETDSLVLAESVVASIEIKSELTKSHLIDALEKCARVKRLKRKGQHVYRKGGVEVSCEAYRILTYVFAYDGPALPTIADHVRQFAVSAQDGGLVPDAICVLTKGVLLRGLERPVVVRQKVQLPSASGSMKLGVNQLQKDSLFVFYRRLLDDVMPLKLELTDLDDYYRPDTLE